MPAALPRLTEREVRIAGHTSQRLLTLRTMAARPGDGTLQTPQGTLKLGKADIEAVLALLIERDENLLVQLDIEIER